MTNEEYQTAQKAYEEDLVRACKRAAAEPGVSHAYEFTVCPKCGQRWQNIDWMCARHQLTCGYPIPRPAEVA